MVGALVQDEGRPGAGRQDVLDQVHLVDLAPGPTFHPELLWILYRSQRFTSVFSPLQPDTADSGPNVLGIVAVVIAGVSAAFAGLAWHAVHRQTNVAERDERQRMKDRREAEGPQFVQEGQSTISEVADVQFRMIGGPGEMWVRIYREDVPWLEGVSTHGRQAHNYVTWESVRPQQLVNLQAHLSVDRTRLPS